MGEGGPYRVEVHSRGKRKIPEFLYLLSSNIKLPQTHSAAVVEDDF
jgi:hypothetical protein